MDTRRLGPQLPMPSDHWDQHSRRKHHLSASTPSRTPAGEPQKCPQPAKLQRGAPAPRPCTHPAAWPPSRLPGSHLQALRPEAGVLEAPPCQAHVSVTCILLLDTQPCGPVHVPLPLGRTSPPRAPGPACPSPHRHTPCVEQSKQAAVSHVPAPTHS